MFPYLSKHQDLLFSIFRIGIGLLFFIFGIQKLLGLWNMPSQVPFLSFIWFAGLGEFLIGLSLIFGVLSRLSSFFGIIEMAIAYVIGHVSQGSWNPAVNQGSPALLFLLAFLAILGLGSKKLSLERLIFKKEFF